MAFPSSQHRLHEKKTPTIRRNSNSKTAATMKPTNTNESGSEIKSIDRQDESGEKIASNAAASKSKLSIDSAITRATVGDSTDKLTVRFADDLAAQLLCHSGVGPGNYLSRSQDNLSSTAAAIAARRRKATNASPSPTTTHSATPGSVGNNRRPVSSLGLPKTGSSGNMFVGGNATRSPRTTASAAQLAQIRKNSLPNGDAVKSSGLTLKNVVNPTESKTRKSPAASSQQVADARITKTKLTVTELQKHKQDLELQVSELVQKAELKQAELATLKMEVRHLKEERDKELENLQRENDRLRLRLRTMSPDGQVMNSTDAASVGGSDGKNLIDVSTSPIPFSNARRRSPGGAMDEIGGVDSTDNDIVSDILFPTTNDAGGGGEPMAGIPSSTRVTADWDRQSTSSMSEVSLACLQDRIVQMEENHYSTNEELQATLQELTDLQDIVNELTKENTQLSEEKSMLLDSLYNQTQKLNNCRLQIENLKHLLLSSTDFRSSNSRHGSNSARSPTSATATDGDHQQHQSIQQHQNQYEQQSDREQQLVDLLKNTHEEHEELACKYDEVRAALKIVNEEKSERSELVEILRDRARMLENQIETLTVDKKSGDDQVRECKQQLDRDRREIARLTNVYEKERCRVEELLRQSNAKVGKDEMHNLLDKLRSEKAAAEDRVNVLEELMNKKTHQIDDLRHECDTLETDLRCSRSETEKTISQLDERIQELERENDYLKKQSMELRATMMELEERCQRHLDDKKEFRANIITLQKTVDDLNSEKERVKRQLFEEQSLREQEADDWRQFQADLQVAVVVANDFKIEAQNDIERLATENGQLRDRLSNLSGELEKLRANRGSPTGSSSKLGSKTDRILGSSSSSTATIPPCPDIRSRMEGYLTSVERSTTGVSQTGSPSSSSTASSSTTGFDSSRAKKYAATIEPMKGLSVRALVESLESATGQPAMNFRTAAPMLRSPGSNRHSAASGSGSSNQSNGAGACSPEMDAQLSKSSGHLASCRPISVDGVEGLLTKQPIKTAASETEVQALVPAALRGSPLKKTMAPVPDVVMNAQAAAIDAAGQGQTAKPTKGILLNRGGSNNGSGRRSGAYLTTDCKDPLAKLMKDAPRGSRRNALLRWCQMRTVGYSGVEITNFSSSWNDGLAFCALLHSLAPEKIPFKLLDAKDKRRNFTIAFQTAAELGIPPSLNVDDMLSLERPDWQSVMSYVTAIYKHFFEG